MNRLLLFFCVCSVLVSCESVTDRENVNSVLRELVDVGYSIKELSIRTDYQEDQLILAYQKDEDVLEDSAKNEEIRKIFALHKEEGITPVNKTSISAYDGIWQIYTKAQNLPRVSLYTGIGVSKVAGALMKRKPLDENDSIRALVGYVNMKYSLEEMPPSIDKYYTKGTTLKDLVVPTTFTRNYPDEIKIKIDYYLYQNEQFELRANENLKKAIDKKIDNHVKCAIDSFINEDVNSTFSHITEFFEDSLEIVNKYKEKLNKRLTLKTLNKEVRDEIISYCVSVNCSRAILINDVLNYPGIPESIDVEDRILLEKYVAKLEEITNITEKKKDNLAVDGTIMIASIPLSIALAKVTGPAAPAISMKATTLFVHDFLAYTGLESIVHGASNYEKNEENIESSTKQMQKFLKEDLNKTIGKSLNKKGNYYESLNENTKQYYKEIRGFFQINE